MRLARFVYPKAGEMYSASMAASLARTRGGARPIAKCGCQPLAYDSHMVVIAHLIRTLRTVGRGRRHTRSLGRRRRSERGAPPEVASASPQCSRQTHRTGVDGAAARERMDREALKNSIRCATACTGRRDVVEGVSAEYHRGGLGLKASTEGVSRKWETIFEQVVSRGFDESTSFGGRTERDSLRRQMRSLCASHFRQLIGGL